MCLKPLFFSAALLFLCTFQSMPVFSQKPTSYQLAWHQQEFYLFVHFGPNTFTDVEWGDGQEHTDIFNPTDLDCRQWCQIAQASGAKGIIITAKHHDGFCLWPSKFSNHTVAQSSWRNGKGDVLKELSDACREYGLHFGVYISPWDRNHPQYGTDAYNDVFVSMMAEIFDNYGPIWELWWDGANGEGPNGKTQVYDWKRCIAFVRQKSPSTVVFSDVGPDIRWVGNEKGIAGTTNWNTLDIEGFEPGLKAPSTDTLQTGNIHGAAWIPAECDVSIRPGWFYHSAEDQKVKSADALFSLYLKSVGRGSNLLLNVPPDRKGRFHSTDSLSLMSFRNLIKHHFKDDICKGARVEYGEAGQTSTTTLLTDGNYQSYITLDEKQHSDIILRFDQERTINCVRIRENLEKGQQVIQAEIQLLDTSNNVALTVPMTTIGNQRILTFDRQSVSAIVFRLLDAKGTVEISEISAFNLDDSLLHIK